MKVINTYIVNVKVPGQTTGGGIYAKKALYELEGGFWHLDGRGIIPEDEAKGLIKP